ncbi:MAG: replication-associated recombination protein A [Gammaproteobacteria bacterium]
MIFSHDPDTDGAALSAGSAVALPPLASRLRPQCFSDFVGQEHVLGPGRPLRELLDVGLPQSMLLWGPPGCGKTSLAYLVARRLDATIHTLSAVDCGAKEIRAVVASGRERFAHQQRTVLFIDEVHRFNKAQQDLFLPTVEDGSLLFIGATTENPAFAVNKALLSRVQVFALRAPSVEAMARVMARALADQDKGLGRRAVEIEAAAVAVSFDRGGDAFYDQISALHKAVRGSSVDAALYWLARMLEGGCDPLYIARRVLRMASEDVGNADPQALSVALTAWETLERLGQPEGDLALAQAVSYVAMAPKSAAVYQAYNLARQEAQRTGSEPVPLHLRNAPAKLLKTLGHGADYRYAHDYPQAYVPGECYLPKRLAGLRLYHPVARGFERELLKRQAWYERCDRGSTWRRYADNADDVNEEGGA